MTLRSVVGFFAHPDDETVLAGGITALLTSQGVSVHLVSATRGEGGELGEPPVCEREQIGQVREAELRCAAAALGATAEAMDYIDPLIGPDDVLYAFECEFDDLAGQIVQISRERRANVILTHGADGEYGHPAHVLLHRAVMAAARKALPGVTVYTMAANVPTIEERLWNKSEPADLALDIGPWAEAKLNAMLCHVSQHALFKRRRQLTDVRDALKRVESVRRALPETHGEPPQDDFAALLRMAGAWQPSF